MSRIGLVFALLSAGLSTFGVALAGEGAFHAGEALPDFGKIAAVNVDQEIPDGSVFNVSFDVKKQANAGAINRSLESAARFINMHAAAGVPLENIELAVVIHGAAVRDVTTNDHYAPVMDTKNVNIALIKALSKKGVKFYVCGQSAAYYDVENDDLLPGVEMALSAMTAHALLQQEGYSLNPF